MANIKFSHSTLRRRLVARERELFKIETPEGAGGKVQGDLFRVQALIMRIDEREARRVAGLPIFSARRVTKASVESTTAFPKTKPLTDEDRSELVEHIQKGTAGMSFDEKWHTVLCWRWMAEELERVLSLPATFDEASAP